MMTAVVVVDSCDGGGVVVAFCHGVLVLIRRRGESIKDQRCKISW